METNRSISPPPKGAFAKVGYAWEWGRKFGFGELCKKPFQMIFSPFILQFKKQRYFMLNDIRYLMFYHRYNFTWTKERSVEIPIIFKFINDTVTESRVLEVGNVLGNYFPAWWDIIDKYEQAKGVLNEDIETFQPKEKYDKIVAISTFEHIGFDSELNPEYTGIKIQKAFNNLKDNCLKNGGSIMITTPMGYNPYMDEIAIYNHLGFTKCSFLKRINKNEWRQVDAEEASKCKYGLPYPFANCIFIGEYIK